MKGEGAFNPTDSARRSLHYYQIAFSCSKAWMTGYPMLNAHRNTMRYAKRICTGDTHCEYVIELKK